MNTPDEKLTSVARGSAPRYSFLWSVYLLVAIVLVGAPGCTVSAPVILAGRLSRRVELLGGRLIYRLIRFMLNLNVWIRKQVTLEDLPRAIGRRNEPAIVVANHRSNLDVYFLISYIPNIRILAKRELFLVPFLGAMMWVTRQIPVRRGNLKSYLQAVEKARRGLRKGDPIFFFPEGKRCEQGALGTGRFYPAAFTLAKDEGVRVYPLVFTGTDHVWPRGKLAMAAGQTATLNSLPPLDPNDFPSAQAMMIECQLRINKCLEEYR